jgi:hypothetical protein
MVSLRADVGASFCLMSSTKPTGVRVTAAEVFFIPVTMRVPLKFGPETVTNVVCLRVRVTVADGSGKTAQGWGETPLSVSWVWPSSLSVVVRAQRKRCQALWKHDSPSSNPRG